MAGHSQDDDGEEELYGADAEDDYVEHAYGLLANVGERGGGVGCDVEAVRSSLDGFDAVIMQNEVKSSLRLVSRRDEKEFVAPLLLKQVFPSALDLVIHFSSLLGLLWRYSARLGYLIWALGASNLGFEVSSRHQSPPTSPIKLSY